MIDVSVILSIYDRRDYTLRSIAYLENQTLDRSRWEIVLVDDNSPGNYLEDLLPWKGKFNIQYAKINAARHPVIMRLNPGGRPLLPPNNEPLKFHTPSLTHNIGFKMSRGKILFITQPDILHHPENLANSIAAMDTKHFLFGRVWMSSPQFRKMAFDVPVEHISTYRYQELVKWPGARASTFNTREHYWFISALDRSAAYQVRGVEEDYLGGVFAEDDQFRERVRMAGWPPANHFTMEGIHMDHTNLSGRHHRSSKRWQWGANENRSMWQRWRSDPKRKVEGNTGREWGDLKYITRHEVWDLR